MEVYKISVYDYIPSNTALRLVNGKHCFAIIWFDVKQINYSKYKEVEIILTFK